MNCNCEKNKCNEPTCGCPVELESACVTVNADFSCSSIESGLTLNQVLEELDTFICTKFSEVSNYFNIVNVGNGAVLYAGIDGVGNKKIKSIISSDDSVVIVENTNTIDITVPTITPPDGSETKINAGTNISVTGNGTTVTPYQITNTFSIGDVSATEEGIVNNTSLQELGGVDKLINGVRIGKGNNNVTYNTVIGDSALEVNTTGTSNSGLGKFVLKLNTSGSYNSAFGSEVLASNTTGFNNTGFGGYALNKNTTGSNNVAIGNFALPSSTTGIDNTVVGAGASYFSTTASRNTAVGFASMQQNTTGGSNVALGYQAGGNLSTGTGNVLLGAQNTFNSGITTGSNNTLIIPNTRLDTGITTGSGNTVIGGVTGLSATSSNSVILADGIGGIVLRSTDTGLTTVPKQTNSLINGDSTGKAVVTKEYLNSLAPDGSETKVTAGSGINVIGVGTTLNPYVISSSAVANLFQYQVIELDVTDTYISNNFDSTGLGINLMAGMAICNGNNGTKNRDGRTSIGYGTGYSTIGATGGSPDAVVVAHTHTMNVSLGGFNAGVDVNGTNAPTPSNAAFSTDSTGVSGNGKNMQPYLVTLMVMKL